MSSKNLTQWSRLHLLRGCEAAASMTSEVKADASFGLSGPDYPQVPILEAVHFFEFSRPRGRSLDDLGGQNRGQIRTQRTRKPPGTNFGGRRCNLNFRGREAAASMTSEVKTEVRFGLSGPSYLLVPVFEAEIGLIIPRSALQKASVPPKKYKKIRTFAL